MTQAEIRALFPELPPSMVQCSALEYAKPTAKFLLEDFAEYYMATLGRLATLSRANPNLSTWFPFWECFNFSNFYLALLQADFARTITDGGATTPAAFRFDYRPDRDVPGDLTGHSVITAITDVGRIFIDPQNPITECTLSANELLLCRRLSD